MNKKKATLAAVGLTGLLILTGCGGGGEKLDGDLVAIDKTELEALVEGATFKEEALYYREYIQELTKGLSESEKQELIEREWQYEVTVNGVKFPTSGELEIEAESLEVTIAERRVPFSVLPMEESVKGKIFQPINQAGHMNGQNVVISTIEQTETAHVMGFTNEKVTSGEIYTVFVQADLAERLGMAPGTEQLVIRIR